MKTLERPNRHLIPGIPSLFEDFILRDMLDSSNGNWKSSDSTLPAVNVAETNDDFTIEVAAPGMKREDFQIELDNNVLTISSRSDDRKQEKNRGSYTRREFNYQSFQRTFSLPEDKIEGERISAKYLDGILYITVPKREEAKIKPPKQISVS